MTFEVFLFFFFVFLFLKPEDSVELIKKAVFFVLKTREWIEEALAETHLENSSFDEIPLSAFEPMSDDSFFFVSETPNDLKKENAQAIWQTQNRSTFSYLRIQCHPVEPIL